MKIAKRNPVLSLMHVWWFELRRVVFSARWLVLSAISCFLIYSYLEAVIRFARDYDLPLVPAGFPFLFADGTFNSLGMFQLVFLVSAFPIRDHLQQNVLIKSGSFIWGTAQMLSIVSVAVLWISEMQLFMVLLIGKHLSFSGWGKVWGSVARDVTYELGYVGSVQVSDEVIQCYEPLQAVLKSMLLLLLVSIIFGMVIFLLDGLCNNYIGEILLSVWSVFCFAFTEFPLLFKTRIFQLISPVHWMNLETYIYKPQKYLHTVLLLIIVIVILYICNQILVHKKRIALD